MNINRWRKTKLIGIITATVLLFALSAGTALAATDVIFTTNGRDANYIAGSSLLIYGKVINNGIGVPYTSTFIDADLNGETIFYGSVETDEDGYFRTGFNIPLSAIVGQTLTITVNGKTEEFVIQDRAEIVSDTFTLDGFTAVGYFAGDEVQEIPTTTSQFGLVFTKNVNYYKNSAADEDLEYMGANYKNADCFTLYEGDEEIDISVPLLEEGGDDAVDYTDLEGNVVSTEAKKVLYVIPKDSLEADTTYKLVISKELTSNNSVPLKDNIVIYFKTAAASGGSGGIGGGGGTPPTAQYTVTFDTRGGSAIDAFTVASGTAITAPPTPTKSGYAFVGWYADSALTTAFDFSSKITEDITLYAKWTEATPAMFADISGHWAQSYIEYLAKLGIVSGRTGDEFDPNANITRAEFVTILARMSGMTLSDATADNLPFSDVDVSDWYADYVLWAYEQGVTTGADGKFQPNANITREDMATMIVRYAVNVAGCTLPETNAVVVFTDEAQIAEYAKEAVQAMQQAGIINGKGDNMFAPGDNATRAEACKMLAILLQGIEG